MKHYKSYMDRVSVSEEFHNKLLGLETPKKARNPWVKYASVAACAALLVGAGVWGAWSAGRGQVGGPTLDADPVQCAAPTMPAEAIDLAPVEGDDIEPGMKTIEGFEVRRNVAGLDVVEYHVLPWIDYGSRNSETVSGQVSGDYAVPEDATFRALGRADVLALAGGEEALETLLDWGGAEFTGTATFNADGSVWELGFSGKRDDFFFELELAPDRLPLTCVIVEPHTTTEIWGVEVTGRYSGAYGEGPDRAVWLPESRAVEFVAGGVGCRFTLYGPDGESEAVEQLVSRFVRHAILEGLDLSAVSPEGTAAAGDGGTDAPYAEDPAPSMPAVNPAASVPPRQTSAVSSPTPAASVSGASPSRGPADN